MNATTFASMLAKWRQRHGYSAAEAAAVLGCRVGTLRHWLAKRAPHYFTMCAVVRQMRDGHDPLTDVRMTGADIANALKEWRAEHGFSQRQAAAAIGTSADVLRGWESQLIIVRQPALAEVLRRLRMPVDVEFVTQATKRARPIEPQKFAELFRAWRRRCKLNREQAAYALRTTGLRTTARTIWVWETARELPKRPLVILALIHGPLAVSPPKVKPLITPRQFATLLRTWRRTHCLTQAQACIALGLPNDQALISDSESGKAFPRKPRLEQLVAALTQPPASGPGTHNWFKARSHEFGKKLRAWRKARGLRQLDACAVLDLPSDQGLICRYERGEASPRRDRMSRILAIIAGTDVQP
jgi:transcriptional regulator with XRE-family HTH domain